MEQENFVSKWLNNSIKIKQEALDLRSTPIPLQLPGFPMTTDIQQQANNRGIFGKMNSDFWQQARGPPPLPQTLESKLMSMTNATAAAAALVANNAVAAAASQNSLNNPLNNPLTNPLTNPLSNPLTNSLTNALSNPHNPLLGSGVGSGSGNGTGSSPSLSSNGSLLSPTSLHHLALVQQHQQQQQQANQHHQQQQQHQLTNPLQNHNSLMNLANNNTPGSGQSTNSVSGSAGGGSSINAPSLTPNSGVDQLSTGQLTPNIQMALAAQAQAQQQQQQNANAQNSQMNLSQSIGNNPTQASTPGASSTPDIKLNTEKIVNEFQVSLNFWVF